MKPIVIDCAYCWGEEVITYTCASLHDWSRTLSEVLRVAAECSGTFANRLRCSHGGSLGRLELWRCGHGFPVGSPRDSPSTAYELLADLKQRISAGKYSMTVSCLSSAATSSSAASDVGSIFSMNLVNWGHIILPVSMICSNTVSADLVRYNWPRQGLFSTAWWTI